MKHVLSRIAMFAGGCALALACENYGPVVPGSGIPAVIGGGTTSAAVSGTWRRTLFFVDNFGLSNANETTWQFAAGGAATRTVVTQNLSLGLADSLVSTGRWQVQGTRIVIDFAPPATGHLEMEFRFDADQLILAGEAFTRVGP